MLGIDGVLESVVSRLEEKGLDQLGSATQIEYLGRIARRLPETGAVFIAISPNRGWGRPWGTAEVWRGRDARWLGRLVADRLDRPMRVDAERQCVSSSGPPWTDLQQSPDFICGECTGQCLSSR
jgi:hypothetical protein